MIKNISIRVFYAHIAEYMPKFGGLAKLHFARQDEKNSSAARVEYHMFGDNIFCSGAAFVPKQFGLEEDDGWIVTFVHNEHTNISQVIFLIYVRVFDYL